MLPVDSPVVLNIEAGVAHIRLNRPHVSNAIDLSAAEALHRAIRAAAADGTARVILVSGAGDRFCAGGDVVAMVRADDRAAYLAESVRALDRALIALADIEIPVVAAVHGAVAGAGLALMLSCDLVVADPATKFVSGYQGVGLTPDCGLSWLLPRAVGQQRALSMLLTPLVLRAPEAHAWGLVSELSAAGRTYEHASALARQLAEGPSHALGHTRRLVRRGWEITRREMGEQETLTISKAVTDPRTTVLLERFVRRSNP